MNDDDEFLPYEEESDEPDQDADADAEYEDDEAFLRGQTDLESDSGWETGGGDDAGYSDTDAALTSGADTDAEGPEELFPSGTDPLAMLEIMEQSRDLDKEGQLKSCELLARQRRLNRTREQAAAAGPQASRTDVFGAGADEIW